MMPHEIEQGSHKSGFRFSFGFSTRAFLFLFLSALISLIIWLLAVLYGQQNHKALIVSNRVISTYNLSAKALKYINPELQSEFIERFNRLGDTEIHERFPNDVVTPAYRTRMWRLIEENLEEIIEEENITIASAVNGEKGLWVSMSIPIKGQMRHYWIFVEMLVFSNDILSNWFLWFVTALLISAIGAYLHTKIFLKPLKEILNIFKILKKNKTPPKLDTSHGSPEVIDVYRTINETLDHLNNINKDREIMLKGLSHDIRTPLSRIRLEVEMAKIDEATKNNIDTDLKQIDHIMHQIHEFSQTAPVDQISPLNVTDAVKMYCQAEEVRINTFGAKFIYDVEPNLHSRISLLDLNRILSNLVGNALKYGKSNDRTLEINLKCYGRVHDIFIDIKDNGPGLDLEDLPRLMKPFERGEPARTGVEGSGLGLPIVDKLTKSIDGKFKILKNYPNGILCRVILKRYDGKNY